MVTSGFVTSYDPGPFAQMYGNLAAVLAGFALAGLVIYLDRQRNHLRASAAAPAAVSPEVITKSLLYSMAALTVCAFLFGSLAGKPDSPTQAAAAMLAYGIVLGSSVLSLFYAMTMLMLNHPVTERAARRTRWVVVVAGPAVVLRFIAAASGDAWRLECETRKATSCHDLPHDPRTWGFVYIVGLVAFSSILVLPRPRRWRLVRWLLTSPLSVRCANVFRARPEFPSFLTFLVATTVGVSSLWAQELPDSGSAYVWVADLGLVLAVLLLLVFAYATGSVLDQPHPTGPSPPPADPPTGDVGPPRSRAGTRQGESSSTPSSSLSTSDRSL